MKYKKYSQKRKYFLDKIQFEIEWNVKKVFGFFGKTIKKIFYSFMETVKIILIKTLKIIMIVTNILFVFSLFMLLSNIGEALSGIKFTNTRYFSSMVCIMGIHFMVVFFSNLLKKKN